MGPPFEPESKQQLTECINKKFESSNQQEKSKDEPGVTLVNVLPTGTTVNSDHYIKHQEI